MANGAGERLGQALLAGWPQSIASAAHDDDGIAGQQRRQRGVVGSAEAHAHDHVHRKGFGQPAKALERERH